MFAVRWSCMCGISLWPVPSICPVRSRCWALLEDGPRGPADTSMLAGCRRGIGRPQTRALSSGLLHRYGIRLSEEVEEALRCGRATVCVLGGVARIRARAPGRARTESAQDGNTRPPAADEWDRCGRWRYHRVGDYVACKPCGHPSFRHGRHRWRSPWCGARTWGMGTVRLRRMRSGVQSRPSLFACLCADGFHGINGIDAER